MDSKAKGILSYLLGFVGGLVVMFGFKDNNKKDVIHAAQSITINLAYIVFGIVIGIVGGILQFLVGFNLGILSFIFGILCLVLIILGLVKVLNGDPDPLLPVVGDIATKIFEKQIAAAPDTVSKAPEAKFDPNTGEPITTPEAKFDPNTGEPIQKEEPAKAETPEEKPAEEAPKE